MTIPYVIEKEGNNERSYDIYSRLLKDRIIMLGTAINDEVSNAIISQLLFLDSKSNNDITIYINSPGGVITSGLAIFDVMNYVKSDISTVCTGMAASMGSFLLTAGTKGKRFALPNSEIMIHQPSGGAEGQRTDILIRANRITKMRDKLETLYAERCNLTKAKIHEMTERDNFLTSEEAKKYGFIDKIIGS